MLVELALRAESARGLVGLLRLGVASGTEQDLAAAELRLVEARARGIGCNQGIEIPERLVRLAQGLPASRELVEHDVGARVIRLLLEQAGVDIDRLACLGLAHARGLAARAVPRLDLQVAEPAHRLGAKGRITALEFEEAAVELLGTIRIGRDGLAGANFRCGALEVLERRRRRRSLGGQGRKRRERQRDRGNERATHGCASCGFAGALLAAARS